MNVKIVKAKDGVYDVQNYDAREWIFFASTRMDTFDRTSKVRRQSSKLHR